VAAPRPLGLRARLLGAWPLCVSGALYLAWRALATDSSSTLPSVNLPLAAARVRPAPGRCVAPGLPLRVFPRALHEDYAALGPSVLAGALLVVGIAGSRWCARAARTRWRYFGAVFRLHAGSVALVTVRWPGFGRYLYLPQLGLPGGMALHRYSERLRPPALSELPEVAAVAYLLALARAVVATYAYAATRRCSRGDRRGAERSHGYGFWGMSKLPPVATRVRCRCSERPSSVRRRAALGAQYGSELLFRRYPGALQIADATSRACARRPVSPARRVRAARTRPSPRPYVLECLLEDPKHAQGRDALTFLRTRHPQAEDFRAQFRALLRESPLRLTALQGGG
jgi:hypothetical protein